MEVTNRDIPKRTKARFKWVSDGKLDSFHILAATGPIEGDCDDYDATVLAELTGRNPLRFLWWLVSFQAVFWFVRDPNGGAHITLWVWGLGYTDNWKDEFTKKETLHKRRFPLLWPYVLYKLGIGLFDKT